MENKRWSLQDAKNRFSEVVEKALREGPQIVTRRGKEAVVVLAADKFKKMTKPRSNLVDFFRNSPLCGVGLDLTRDPDPGKDIEL